MMNHLAFQTRYSSAYLDRGCPPDRRWSHLTRSVQFDPLDLTIGESLEGENRRGAPVWPVRLALLWACGFWCAVPAAAERQRCAVWLSRRCSLPHASAAEALEPARGCSLSRASIRPGTLAPPSPGWDGCRWAAAVSGSRGTAVNPQNVPSDLAVWQEKGLLYFKKKYSVTMSWVGTVSCVLWDRYSTNSWDMRNTDCSP